jgi:hypothetical protein
MKSLVTLTAVIACFALSNNALAQQSRISKPPSKRPTMEEAKRMMPAGAKGLYYYSTVRLMWESNSQGCGFGDWDCFTKYCETEFAGMGSKTWSDVGQCTRSPDTPDLWTEVGGAAIKSAL